MQSPDQAERSSRHRACGPEGGVDEQDATLLDAERPELLGNLGAAQLIGFSGPVQRCPRRFRATCPD
ncbi:hypothetical protein BH23GEM5_BH23GEM5_11470 [soil metagenome]